MAKILILNGPNLNMLGQREPEIYGEHTLNDIETLCEETARTLDMSIDFRQSNYEGELVDWIQEAVPGKMRHAFDGLIINAAAYTHTSLAIHDALKMLDIPVIEVHLSDPKKREKFRRHSYIESVAKTVFAGHGEQSYVLALEKMAQIL